MMMRVCLAAVCAFMVLGSPAVAQSTTFDQPDSARNDLPSAESLFEKHIEAIGGREAMEKVQSRKMSGTYTGAPFRFPTRVTIWQKAPDKMHLKIVEPAGVQIQVAYDGEQAWEEQGIAGFRMIEGDRLAWLREDAVFWGVADYERVFKKMTTVGTGALNGRAMFIVRVTTHSGREQNLLFDAITGLFSARRSGTTGPNGEEVVTESVVLDYKDFGGVKFPTRMAQNQVGTPYQALYEYKEIEIDVDLDHDYGLPPELQENGSNDGSAASETEG